MCCWLFRLLLLYIIEDMDAPDAVRVLIYLSQFISCFSMAIGRLQLHTFHLQELGIHT